MGGKIQLEMEPGILLNFIPVDTVGKETTQTSFDLYYINGRQWIVWFNTFLNH